MPCLRHPGQVERSPDAFEHPDCVDDIASIGRARTYSGGEATSSFSSLPCDSVPAPAL